MSQDADVQQIEGLLGDEPQDVAGPSNIHDLGQEPQDSAPKDATPDSLELSEQEEYKKRKDAEDTLFRLVNEIEDPQERENERYNLLKELKEKYEGEIDDVEDYLKQYPEGDPENEYKYNKRFAPNTQDIREQYLKLYKLYVLTRFPEQKKRIINILKNNDSLKDEKKRLKTEPKEQIYNAYYSVFLISIEKFILDSLVEKGVVNVKDLQKEALEKKNNFLVELEKYMPKLYDNYLSPVIDQSVRYDFNEFFDFYRSLIRERLPRNKELFKDYNPDFLADPDQPAPMIDNTTIVNYEYKKNPEFEVDDYLLKDNLKFYNDNSYIYDGTGVIGEAKKFGDIYYDFTVPTRVFSNRLDADKRFYWSFDNKSPAWLLVGEDLGKDSERRKNILDQVEKGEDIPYLDDQIDRYQVPFITSVFNEEDATTLDNRVEELFDEDSFTYRFVSLLAQERYRRSDITNKIQVHFTFNLLFDGEDPFVYKGRLFGFNKVDNQLASKSTSVSIIKQDFASLFDEDFDVKSHITSFMEEMKEKVRDVMNTKHEGYNKYLAFFKCNNLRINVKTVFSASGGYVDVKDEYKKYVYSPTQRNGCVLECFKACGLMDPVTNNIFMKNLSESSEKGKERIITSTISMSKLPLILSLMETKKRVIIYKFDNDGRLNKGTRYDSKTYSGTPEESYGFIVHNSHMMWIKDISSKPIIRKNWFTFVEDVERPYYSCEYDDPEKIKNPKKEIHQERLLFPSNIRKSKAHDGFKPVKNVYFWDIEAYHTDGGFVPYQVSLIKIKDINAAYKDMKLFNKGELQSNPNTDKYEWESFYGEDCMKQFIERLIALNKELRVKYLCAADNIIEYTCYRKDKTLYDKFKKYSSSDFSKLRNEIISELIIADNAQIILFGHNSSRFDNILLLKNSYAQQYVTDVLNSGGILMLILQNTIFFKDFYRFFSQSLDKICKDLKIPKYLSKADFPYEFVTKDNIYYKGPVPEAKYWKDGIPDEYAINKDKVFDLKAYTEYYAKLDVISLGLAVYIMSEKYFEITRGYTYRYSSTGEPEMCVDQDSINNRPQDGYYLWDFLTTPSMSNAFATEYLNACQYTFTIGDKKYDDPVEAFNNRHLIYRECARPFIKPITYFDKKDGVYCENTENMFFYLTKKVTKKAEKIDIKPITNANGDDFLVYVVKDYKIDEFIRKSSRGGRVLVQKKSFETSDQDKLEKIKEINESNMPEIDKYKAIKEIIDTIEDYLVCLDAVSLYPSAMSSYTYPTGKCYWVHPDSFERYRQNLNNGMIHEKYFTIECDITYPDKTVVTPTLMAKNKEGLAQYNLLDKRNIVCTNVDIEEAIKYNHVRITKVHRILEWPTSRAVYKDNITMLFNERLRAKKNGEKALSICQKDMMNSQYGYTIKKLIKSKSVLVDNNDSFEALIIDRKCTFVPVGENMRVDYELNDCEIRPNTPCHLGTFILANSKRLMNSYIHCWDGYGLEPNITEEQKWDRSIYYGDTDSVYVHKKYMDLVKDQVNPFGKKWEGKGMTQFHDDVDEDVDNPKIISAKFLMPKVKMVKYVGYKVLDIKKVELEAELSRCLETDVDNVNAIEEIEKKIKKLFDDEKGYNKHVVSRPYKPRYLHSKTTFKGVMFKAKNDGSASRNADTVSAIYDENGKKLETPNRKLDETYDFQALSDGKAIELKTRKFTKSYKLDWSVKMEDGKKMIGKNKWVGRILKDNWFIPLGYSA